MAEHDLISKTALLEHLDMAMECENCPRNADKELYKCVHNSTSEHCTCSDIAQICIRITEFATFADVQPICHGRWVNEYLEDDGVWWADCTNCKNDTHSKFGRVSSYAFCPNCGAKMDLKEGDVE